MSELFHRDFNGCAKVPLFRQPGRFWDRIQSIAQKFREKGATSAERAMTAQELGLPPRFEEAMRRRLGQTGIFVDVGGGRYYLNEARLKEMEVRRQQRGQGGYRRGGRGSMLGLRIARMCIAVLAVALGLINALFIRSTPLWLVVVTLVVIWICISIAQIVLIARRRSGMGPGYGPGYQQPDQWRIFSVLKWEI